MLDNLQAQSPDALLALIKMFAADDRTDKIDLGVGVYRTDDGATPVFAAIKQAERRLVETQDSKAYLGPEGDMGFVHALMPYIFGQNATRGGRIEGMQTPGGTGAVRLAFALVKQAGVRRVALGMPSWPNHAQILEDLGLEVIAFDHARPDGTADIDAVLSVIETAREGDALLLHGCCHNPTGIDYTADGWAAIAAALADSAMFPVIDVAYQGLGQGMEEDAAGLRTVVDAVPEALIAYSCDKNFGLYRDRVGAFYVLAQTPSRMDIILSNANALARATWSMPPDHGAAAVREVLRDETLTDQWQDELAGMRARLRTVRDALAEADGKVDGVDLAPLGHQNGLFGMLQLDAEQIRRLREEHGIYMAGSGRINIAGLTKDNVAAFTTALAAVAR